MVLLLAVSDVVDGRGVDVLITHAWRHLVDIEPGAPARPAPAGSHHAR